MSPSYVLSESDHALIYQDLEKRLLNHAEPQKAPVAIITGGQPGAGKSGLTSAAKDELVSSGGFVLVDADLLRASHPQFKSLLLANDREAANLTHPDAGKWAGSLYKAARDSRRNLIIDQTSKNDRLLVLAESLRDHGYFVDLRVMAVPARVSEQRIFTRYETQKSVAGYGRYSTQFSHDDAYRGIPSAVEQVEKSKAVDWLRLFDKSHQVIYENTLVEGRWTREPAASEALLAERNRPMTLKERSSMVDAYEKLSVLIAAPSRRATADEVSAITQRLERATRERDAELFRALPPAIAIHKAPWLVEPTAVLAAVSNDMKASGRTGQPLATAIEMAKEKIASAIEAGTFPRVKVRGQQQSVDRGVDGQER